MAAIMNKFVDLVPGDQRRRALFGSHKIKQQEAQHDCEDGPWHKSADRDGYGSNDTAGMRIRGEALAHDGLRKEDARSAVKNVLKKEVWLRIATAKALQWRDRTGFPPVSPCSACCESSLPL